LASCFFVTYIITQQPEIVGCHFFSDYHAVISKLVNTILCPHLLPAANAIDVFTLTRPF